MDSTPAEHRQQRGHKCDPRPGKTGGDHHSGSGTRCGRRLGRLSATGTLVWFQPLQCAPQSANPAANGLGLNLLLGPDAGVMVRNLALNAQEDRIGVIQALYERV